MTVATELKKSVDVVALEEKVKAMYRDVATNPHGDYHFEMGREMAERLGYLTADLDAIPQQSIDSFAGVGYYFDLAELKAGETVVDLGSGSGMDTFVAALKVGETGRVIGIDMTDEQLDKARSLRDGAGFDQVTYQKAYIESTGLESESTDAVISNGVVNLAPVKEKVFREAARILRSGGRLALSDIVTDTRLPEGITCDATLWAACIGGALQIDDYIAAIEAAGLKVERVKHNPEYQFISDSAQGATSKFGVKSVSILAVKP
ncbi:MAG: methyltransferase domain-containing protein [Betaproteobacteria bacterium]|nr:MAG: methyltransferase domain-containing protein [Betaproteobacteria bacterium]